MGYLKALHPGKLGVILINIEISYIFLTLTSSETLRGSLDLRARCG